jgi:hypothetical protein
LKDLLRTLEGTMVKPQARGHQHAEAIKAGRAAEGHRKAVCAATRAAVAAGAFEIPPRAGSLGARRTLDDLLGETPEGRALMADAERHTGLCMRRVPDRPPSVWCECVAGQPRG